MRTTYTFEKCLGRGGFGEVYLATRRSPDGIIRKVAVKVLRIDVGASDQAVARLRDEARLLAILAHPAIVTAFELTRIKGRIALVTEYVDGVDLTSFCHASRRLPPRVLLSITAEIAGALDCAFNTPSPETGKPLQLVHRDVKPENIRMSRRGEAKLLDFGIARSSEITRSARTGSGSVPFTPGYTAPEAFVALRQEPATDIFALGATLYRLLGSERFYEKIKLSDQAALSSSPEQYARYLDQRLKRLPDASRDQRHIIDLLRICLSYDPAARPSASELQLRSESLEESADGPPARRWAREAAFPAERVVEEGELLGQTASEDRPGDSILIERPTVRMPRSPRATPAPAPPRLPPPAVSPFPWLALTVGFLSLGLGALVLTFAAFAAGMLVGR